MFINKMSESAGSLSYVGILVLLGLPLWWQTTTVCRANLPYTQISDLSLLSSVQQKVHVLLVTDDAINTHKLGPQLQSLFMKSEVYDIELTVRELNQEERETIKQSDTLEELDEKIGNDLSLKKDGWIILFEVPGSFLTSIESAVAGNYRIVYFERICKAEDLTALVMDVMLGEYFLHNEWKNSDVVGSRSLPDPGDRLQAGNQASKKTTGRLDLQLSLLVPEPDFVVANWQIQQAVDRHIKPFLQKFPLEVSINSQVLYLAELSIKRNYNNGMNVTGEQIGLALNHVESLLNSQSSVNPALNLIIYIPKIEQSPLRVENSPDGCFVVPRWGGVIVYNYFEMDSPDYIGFKFPTKLDLDMEKISGIWLGQLRTLLGVPEVDHRRALPLNYNGVRTWEIDYQQRYRSQDNLLETRSTLQSLSGLLGQISNIVITEQIARHVETALEAMDSSIEELGAGNLVQGHLASQQAIQQAEAAFFDPSLLALLYFPDDQKYAIYVPYFVPVGLPILLSIKSMIKMFKSREKVD